MLKNVLFDSQIPIDPENMQNIVYAAKQTRSMSPYSTGRTDTIGVLNPRLMQQQNQSPELQRVVTGSLLDLIQSNNSNNNRDLYGTGMSWEQIQRNKEFLQSSRLDKPSGVPLDPRYFMN